MNKAVIKSVTPKLCEKKTHSTLLSCHRFLGLIFANHTKSFLLHKYLFLLYQALF